MWEGIKFYKLKLWKYWVLQEIKIDNVPKKCS
jgi:hypothetical protein